MRRDVEAAFDAQQAAGAAQLEAFERRLAQLKSAYEVPVRARQAIIERRVEELKRDWTQK